MGANDRTVQHLRLRAPSAQMAVHAAHRLEDALRCASLPDAGERLLLVRRLHLGGLPMDLSSQSLSVLIEQRVRDVGGRWVHGEHGSAAESPAVFFESRLQAVQAAVRRRAEGRSLSAWFWRLALHGVQIDASDGEFMHSVIAAEAQKTTAPASLPALVADIVVSGHADWLIRHVPQEAWRLLLDASGAQCHMADALRLRDADPSALALRPVRRSVAGQWHPLLLPCAWPAWLHAVLHAAQWLPEAMPDTSGRAVRMGQTASDTTVPLRDADSALQPGLEVHVERTTAGSAPWPQHAFAGIAPAVAVPPSPVHCAEHTAPAESPWVQTLDAITPPPFDAALPTQAGGLLCLLNVLARLGFADWQAQHPDTPLCGPILSQALHRLDVPDHDAAWALTASLSAPPTRHARSWQMPACWQDAHIAVAHEEGVAITPAAMAALWLTACRRYLRRMARIGLASLVCRTAQLRWSATHLETRFALCEADLRVRRAALDVDPGWLDWLGRVATFHYLQQLES